MANKETLKLACQFVFPQMLIVAVIFFVIIYEFPSFRLTFGEFTLVYWILSIVSFLLTCQVIRWTRYVVKNYGLQKERNPYLRNMLAKGDLKGRQKALLGLYLFLFFFYIIGINAPVCLPFLAFPSWILMIFLSDFLNDFYWVRKLRAQSRISD